MDEVEGTEGEGLGVLKGIILIIMVIVIIMYFSGQIYLTWKERSDARLCRDSIELHAAGKLWGLKSVSESLNCPPRYVKLKLENTDKSKKQVADMMAECFWKFGENKYDLFSGGYVGQSNFCALCTHLTPESGSQSVSDFSRFLAEKPVPSRFGEGSYAQYILGRPTDAKELDTIKAISAPEIQSDQNYGIMLLYIKDEHLDSRWTAAFGMGGAATVTVIGGVMVLGTGVFSIPFLAVVSASGIAGGAAGYSLGSDRSADWQTAVVLIPYNENDIKRLGCTYMPAEQGNK
jgi:hypothetical protein